MTPGLTQGILKREIQCFVYAEVGLRVTVFQHKWIVLQGDRNHVNTFRVVPSAVSEDGSGDVLKDCLFLPLSFLLYILVAI